MDTLLSQQSSLTRKDFAAIPFIGADVIGGTPDPRP